MEKIRPLPRMATNYKPIETTDENRTISIGTSEAAPAVENYEVKDPNDLLYDIINRENVDTRNVEKHSMEVFDEYEINENEIFGPSSTSHTLGLMAIVAAILLVTASIYAIWQNR